MKEYAALPESLVKNAVLLTNFVKRSYDYALSMPPKPEKRKKK
jgi:hypothetical protein